MSAKNPLTTRRSSDALVVNPKRAPGPKFNSAGGLKPLSQLERKAEFPTTSQEEPRFPLLNSRCGSIALLRLERNADVPVAPQEEAGICLTLEGNPGILSQCESHVFPHPLKIRPDSFASIGMSAENQLTT